MLIPVPTRSTHACNDVTRPSPSSRTVHHTTHRPKPTIHPVHTPHPFTARLEFPGQWEHPVTTEVSGEQRPCRRQGHAFAKLGSRRTFLFGGHWTDQDSWATNSVHVALLDTRRRETALQINGLTPKLTPVLGGETIRITGQGFRDGSSYKVRSQLWAGGHGHPAPTSWLCPHDSSRFVTIRRATWLTLARAPCRHRSGWPCLTRSHRGDPRRQARAAATRSQWYRSCRVMSS